MHVACRGSRVDSSATPRDASHERLAKADQAEGDQTRDALATSDLSRVCRYDRFVDVAWIVGSGCCLSCIPRSGARGESRAMRRNAHARSLAEARNASRRDLQGGSVWPARLRPGANGSPSRGAGRNEPDAEKRAGSRWRCCVQHFGGYVLDTCMQDWSAIWPLPSTRGHSL